MVYGKSMRRPHRTYRRRRTRFAKKAVPVPKKRINFKRKNALAVNRLARDVKYLKSRCHGKMQSNLQVTRAPFVPYATQPVLFDLTNFACFNPQNPTVTTGPDFYQYNTATPPVLQNVTNFTIQNFSDNPYWAGQNLDTVDTGQYLPVSVHITMRFQCLPSAVDQRVRVQVFSLRPKAIVSAITPDNVRTMPNGLAHMNDLAFPTLNRLNREFVHVWLDKWCYFSSANNFVDPPGGVFEPINPDNPGGAVTGNSRIVKFSFHPKKPRTQLVTQPIVSELDPTIQPDGGSFSILNCPQDQPLWCLVSSSVSNTSGSVISCNVQRYCKWRDPIGSSQVAV